ncbi:MAG: DUF6152 family protein [Pseudomonadales bacterium]|jgi:hypothetical protein|nr:DUF6152 family protein [Pseudomonadales bacterium]
MRTRSGRILPAMCLAAAALFTSLGTPAHHSFSAEFDVGRPIEFTGTVVAIEWTNPHAWVHIEATDEPGNRQQWAIELVGINALVRSGLNRRTVKIGHVLTVSGFGARNGTRTANATLVTRTETREVLWATAGFSRD